LVYIHAKVQKGVAEFGRRRILSTLGNFMSGPAWRLKPIRSGYYIQFSILVDVGYGYAFRNKIGRQGVLYKLDVSANRIGVLGFGFGAKQEKPQENKQRSRTAPGQWQVEKFHAAWIYE
jgi:hypothetical protein